MTAPRFTSIRTRVLFVLGLSVVLVLLLTGLLLTAYRRLAVTMVHRAYSQTLSVMSTGVEDGLRGVRELAVRIATDPDLQARIKDLNSETDGYRRSLKSGEIVSRLGVGSLPPYLAAVYLIDNTGAVTASRLDYPPLSALVDETTIADFRGSREPYRWIYTSGDPHVFLLLRRIREVAELSLRQLGVLVVAVDTDRFVRSVFKGRFGRDLDLGILLDGRLVYTSNPALDPARASAAARPRDYGTVVMAGRRYFATTIASSATKLRYVSMVPYDLLFGRELVYNRVALAAHLVLLVALLAFAARVARGISGPVVRLADAMKKIESEDLSRVALSLGGERRQDEIGVLYREFRVMLERIDALIDENYRKQLLIQDARFRNLQAQINPHFLYNTLESINWLAQLNDQQVIASMVQALGHLLRASIGGKRPIITLAEEVDLLRQYVLIQKLRYGERLGVRIDLPQGLAAVAVPKLTLQPLVENSIKYGLESTTGRCSVIVAAAELGAGVLVTIRDDGPGMTPAVMEQILCGRIPSKGSGVGIQNIRDRIAEIYGEDGSLEIESHVGSGVEVRVALPRLTVDELDFAARVEG